MRCTNETPQLDKEGKVMVRPHGGAYWGTCAGDMTREGRCAPEGTKGDGRAPVSVITYTCPRCGASQSINDFGNLDGIKRTPKNQLYKTKPAKVAKLRYHARWATTDGHGHREEFSTSRDMRTAEPRIRAGADVVPGSLELRSR